MKLKILFACVFMLLQTAFNKLHGQTEVNTVHQQLKEATSPQEKTKLLLNLANIYCETVPDSAIYYANYVLEHKSKLKVSEIETGKAINLKGIAYWVKGELAEALTLFSQALKIFELHQDNNGKILILNNMGNIHENLEQNEQAKKRYTEAAAIAKQIQDKENEALSISNLAILYHKAKSYDTAFAQYQFALDIYSQLNSYDGVARIGSNMGFMFAVQGKYHEAEQHLLNSLEARKKTTNRRGLIYNYLGLGNVSKDNNNLQKAEAYYKQALVLADSIGALREKLSILVEISNLNVRLNNQFKAHEYLSMAFAIKDSIYKIDNQQIIQELSVKYETEKKELEIANLQHQTEKQDAELALDKTLQAQQAESLKNTRLQLIGSIVLLGMVIFVVVMLIKNNRYQKRINSTLSRQKEQLSFQRDQISDLLGDIKSSITYAKRIQDAILPSEQKLSVLNDYFVLYLPKDVVAGDFYWMEQIASPLVSSTSTNGEFTVFLAAADCTGHGVPGAMMSVVCSNALNRAVHEFGCTTPAAILDQTRKLVIDSFAGSNQNIKDGMDISLVALSSRPVEADNYPPLQWAGANNPLWIIRNGTSGVTELDGVTELVEAKPDKQPIGNFDKPKPFTNHSIDLQKGDTIYIFTDGFQDQFGGENGKKFKAANLKSLLLSIQHESMARQRDLLLNAFEDWKGDLEQVDDVCVIGVRV